MSSIFNDHSFDPCLLSQPPCNLKCLGDVFMPSHFSNRPARENSMQRRRAKVECEPAYGMEPLERRCLLSAVAVPEPWWSGDGYQFVRPAGDRVILATPLSDGSG